MSFRRVLARVVVVVIAVSAALVIAAPAALADSPSDVCAAFPHKQTYTDDGFFRAPAWRYGKTVTVVYDAEDCTAEVAPSGDYVLTLSGQATIYEGDTADGRPLDERPFSSVIRTDSAGDALGWPIRWWKCFDGSFTYIWSISDVYTFGVTATDGRWLMYQREEPMGGSSVTTFNACAEDDRRKP